MLRFVVVNPDLVYSLDSKSGGVCTVDDLPNVLGKQSKPLLFAVVPQAVGRVLATERTIDSALPQQFPGANSFSFEPLETNAYMAYVASDELLGKLRALGRDVRLVPYPPAVYNALQGAAALEKTNLFERTRMVLTTAVRLPGSDDAAKSMVAIDVIGSGMLISAFRGKEVVAVRFAQGGDPLMEVQRTVAGARIDSPTIYCKDPDLLMELQAHGYTAQIIESRGAFIGETSMEKPGLEKLLQLRFLNEQEVMQKKAAEGRKRAVSYFLAAAVLLGVVAGVDVLLRTQKLLVVKEGEKITETKVALTNQLSSLYQERYGSLARKQSIAVREELLDLSIALPPQVSLVTIEKTQSTLKATIERHPQAAPFTRDDLVSALTSSSLFGKATIKEDYEGHTIRYVLTKTTPPPAAAGGAP